MQNSVIICLSSLILFAAPAIATRLFAFSGLPSILRFSFSLVLQQLFFATSAAVFGSYFIAFPLAAVLTILTAYTTSKKIGTTPAPTTANPSKELLFQLLPWIIFGITFFTYAAIRANYSYINFNNTGDEAGVEKLFNLSLQQSFLFGESYPPEWIWLGGEPIRYYVLLKSIPGLAAWIANTLFANPATGGIFFILSEAFFGALPYGVICGWVLWFGRNAKSKATIAALALLLSIFCLVATHYQALSLGLSALLTRSPLDWWLLSRQVIPYTDNQYPVWLMLLGDNHAYMQVYFLQILFWGAFVSLILLNQVSFLLAACVGVLASALILSHSGSVLVDLTVFSVFISMYTILCIRWRNWNRIKVLATHAAIGAIVTLFFLVFLYSAIGKVNITIPPKELVSQPLAFLNLNFSVLLWALLLFAIPVIFFEALGNIKRNVAKESVVILSVILIIVCYLCNLPALSLMALLACIVYLAIHREDSSETEQILCLFAVASFSIWIPPEIIAFDHAIDNRTLWIRFQMSLRFWPEGYFLIPLALTLATIQRIGERPLPRIWAAASCAVIALFILSHIAGVSNRISRSQQKEAEIDGFLEFSRRYPADGAIVSFLRGLDANRKILIAESCGTGDARVPHDFAWPGRIAAFSGRRGVCGWARHAVLYNNPLEQVGFKGSSVEGKTSIFLKSYSSLFNTLASGQFSQANIELMTLKAIGVTHIVFGQYEKALFPQFSIESSFGTLPLKIEFNASNGMGIIKINE